MFLEVVGKTSERIVSVDVNGVLCIWRYEREYFSGQCRFVPETNLELDHTVMAYAPMGDGEEALPGAPRRKCRPWTTASSETPAVAETVEEYLPPAAAMADQAEFNVYGCRTTHYRPVAAGAAGVPAGEGEGEGGGDAAAFMALFAKAKEKEHTTVQWYTRRVARRVTKAELSRIAISDDGEALVVAVAHGECLTLLPLDFEDLSYKKPFPELRNVPSGAAVRTRLPLSRPSGGHEQASNRRLRPISILFPLISILLPLR